MWRTPEGQTPTCIKLRKQRPEESVQLSPPGYPSVAACSRSPELSPRLLPGFCWCAPDAAPFTLPGRSHHHANREGSLRASSLAHKACCHQPPRKKIRTSKFRGVQISLSSLWLKLNSPGREPEGKEQRSGEQKAHNLERQHHS